MAAKNLQDDASCSICVELFQDPVSIHCGHSFCRACITRSWEGVTTNFSCPLCRKMAAQQSLRPNWELAKLVETAKSLKLQPVREVEGGENLCEEHQEPLKLFCENEEKLICVVCDRSKVHRDHSVVPMSEAAQEYKERIQTQLRCLRSRQKTLCSSVKDAEGRVQAYTKKMEAEKQKIVTLYKELHKFLEVQEALLLAQQEQLDTNMMKMYEEILGRLLEARTSLGTQIREVERLCQQPDWELLKDIKTTLSRCQREKLSPSLGISPQLKNKFREFRKKTTNIKDTVEDFQGRLAFDLLPPTTKMTLDPNTSYAYLHLSGDHREVWHGNHKRFLPISPQRFTGDACVLGSVGFTSGQHCWEVEIRKGWCSIGVAKESVPRDKSFSLTSEVGLWALRCFKDEQEALAFLKATPLVPPNVLRRVQVFLDYEAGRVEFYDAESKRQVLACPQAAFNGEKVYPWFLVPSNAHLALL